MIAEALIYQVGLLFLMLVPGIILAKCGLSTTGLGKGLANLVLYVAQPALIVVAYVRAFDWEIMMNAIWVFIFSILYCFKFIASSILSELCKFHPQDDDRHVRL